MISALSLVISDHILHLVQITTTRLYWITFIFRKATFNFADIFVFALIYKCIEAARNDGVERASRMLRMVHILIMIVLSLLQVVSLGWYIYYIVAYFSDYTQSTSALPAVDVAYSALAFAISIEIVYWSASISARKRLHKVSLALLMVDIANMLYSIHNGSSLQSRY